MAHEQSGKDKLNCDFRPPGVICLKMLKQNPPVDRSYSGKWVLTQSVVLRPNGVVA
jgi:hypothetical protein